MIFGQATPYCTGKRDGRLPVSADRAAFTSGETFKPYQPGGARMADFIIFDEGANALLDFAFGPTTKPTEYFFALSTKKVGTEAAGEHKVGDKLSGITGENTGTGYARKAVVATAVEAAAARVKKWAQQVWATAAATDWSNTVKSVVLCTTNDNTGKQLCAWNLQTGGTARDLSGANTEEKFTPTFSI